MKLAEVLEEEPQSIPSLDRNEVQKASNYCLQNINSAKEIEKLDDDASLYQLEDGGTGYYFVYDISEPVKSRVVYFVKYHVVEFDQSLSPSKAIRQVLVWRNKDNHASTKVANKVFWDILWPKYKCLASDSQQTEKGKNFWSFVVKEALDKKLTVRVINTNDKTFIDVKSNAEFKKQIPSTWGNANWFQRMIVVIFK